MYHPSYIYVPTFTEVRDMHGRTGRFSYLEIRGLWRAEPASEGGIRQFRGCKAMNFIDAFSESRRPGTEAGGGRDPHLLGTSRHDRSAVFRVRDGAQTVRPSTGAAVAAPGQMPISDHPARRAAAKRMPGTQSVGSDVEPSSRFTALFEALAIESRKAATGWGGDRSEKSYPAIQS